MSDSEMSPASKTSDVHRLVSSHVSDIGKWCFLTDPRCKGQLALAQEVRPSGMRMLAVGIVPYDEYRLATESEVEKWLGR